MAKAERTDWHLLYKVARDLHMSIEEWDDWRGGAPHAYGIDPEKPCERCMQIAKRLEKHGITAQNH